MPLKLTTEEIDAAKSEKGGWSKATLAQWGIGWPPPKGWKEMLIAGDPVPQPGVDGFPASSSRPSACPEAALLHQVVMTVIETGHGHLLAGLDELNAYYGASLPTVADVVGKIPRHAIVTGGIMFDDKVFSFTCARRA